MVNVPSQDLVEEVWICGDKYAGNPIPKGTNELTIAGLTAIPAEKVKPPRIKECYGHIECRVNWIKDVGDHFLVLGDIVRASFTNGYLDKAYIVNVVIAKPLMEIAKNLFSYPENVVVVNRSKVKTKVKSELARMKITLSNKLQQYEDVVISE